MRSTSLSRRVTARRSVAGVFDADRFFTRIAVVVVIATAAAVTAGALLAPEPPAPVGWTSIEVAGTGTLWEIASHHGVPGLSTAETVDLIQAENDLSSSTLHTGQTLRVPAFAEAAVAVAQR